jgi:outer membrane lipoprotein-sorting protein
VRCDAVQLAISRAMDGDGAVEPGEDAHARTCPRCGPFAARAQRLRHGVRLAPAPEVPDLVPVIMVRVREVRLGRSSGGEAPPRPARLRRARMARAIAAALVLGLVAGFAVTRSGLLPVRGPERALASSVPGALVRAATDLRGYRATFDMTERGWSPRVRTRTFVAAIAYRAPERLRITVTDTTRYPAGLAVRNDLFLVTDGRTWHTQGPEPCVSPQRGVCRDGGGRTVVRRPPFDQQSPLPTDLIVPMTVLAAERRVPVIGTGTVAGRQAVRIDLPFEQTASLLQALEFMGSWRPFYPQDRATLWLDRATWFPLRYEIRPALGPERAMWAARAGLPHEPPDRPVFVASVRSLSTVVPQQALFHAPGDPTRSLDAIDEGFMNLPIPSAAGWLRPADVAGLTAVRYGRFVRTAERPYQEAVLAYARGLAWLTVSRVTGWRHADLFGVDGFAEAVALPGGGTGYYEPATGPADGATEDARRVALHTAVGEIVIESNLPRGTLLRVAGSLPARGLPEPAAWRVHRWPGGELIEGLSPVEAIRLAPFQTELPAVVGGGYRPVAAELSRVGGGTTITIAYRRPAADPGGTGLWLSQTAATALPPPTDPSEEQVALLGGLARWSPDRHLLEWVDGGVYHSLSADDLDLSALLLIAETMRPVAPS